VQFDRNSSKNDCLFLSGIELFGTAIERLEDLSQSASAEASGGTGGVGAKAIVGPSAINVLQGDIVTLTMVK
jgi:hypothetical protein